MKQKFIIGCMAIMMLITINASVTAQMVTPKVLTTTSYGLALDTVTNTATKSTTPADGLIKVWKNGITAQVVVTKISGTVGGSISFQGSMDGTNWTTIGSAATATDASNTYGFNTTARWYYYRVSWTGTGTMSASFRARIFSY